MIAVLAGLIRQYQQVAGFIQFHCRSICKVFSKALYSKLDKRHEMIAVNEMPIRASSETHEAKTPDTWRHRAILTVTYRSSLLTGKLALHEHLLRA